MLLYVLCKQYQNYEWKIKFKVDLIMFWLLFLDKVNKIGSRAGIKTRPTGHEAPALSAINIQHHSASFSIIQHHSASLSIIQHHSV